MKMPWSNKTGLAKIATIFALLLTVSIGLCGANLALFSRYGAVSGGAPAPPRSAGGSMVLMATGFAELFGMGVGAVGLVIVGLVAAVKAVVRGLKKDKEL